MNIAVCIKQVPGTTEVEIDEETGVLKRDGAESKMNPFDLFAIEEALRIKRKTGAGVTVVSMGPPQTEQVIREAYMMGVDEGVLLSDRRFAGSDVLATSHTLAQGLKQSGPHDLIICGKQTTDGDTAQVGPEIAEFLNIPHAASVRNILELGEKSVIVEMDLPDSLEVAEIQYPCLITVEKDINQPRLPSFKLKMATSDRQVRMVALDDLEDKDEKNYGLKGSPTQVVKIFPPESNDEHELWEDDGQTLANRLYERLYTMKFITQV